MPRPADLADRRARFRALHAQGCFVIPNAWDVGSARFLASLGFRAIATTSSGFAWSEGRPDEGVGVDEVLAHCERLVEATDLPVNADFEDGHADDLDTLAHHVRRCVATGVAALSIEDGSNRPDLPRYPFDKAVERLRAARRAIDATGEDVMLVGRAEHFRVVADDPLRDTLRRLEAYAEAGADVLFAPGLRTREDIAAAVRAVAPKPMNVVIGFASDLAVADLAALGVRRVSVGGGLAAAAWGGFARAARALAEGRFDGFAQNMPPAELNALFAASR